MTRLVLDTNTVMALWFFEDPALAPLRRFIDAGDATLLARDDALEELRRVLGYRQFACTPAHQGQLWQAYRDRVALVAMGTDGDPLPKCRDADDQKFLEIARDGDAAGLLTRDKALLRCGRHRLVRERFAILTPERWQTEVLPTLAAQA
ncbi:PIN domain-containing protein [Nitrogeniibacter mangrovi]|uniref:PIN domain-containing protein n=1 Tax=Nitrogeniibacter mangrovi TaxID=2016596 RepID=A0A6C1AYW4_9RHOO|nr:PIN domain-containing protein [Nitrogeniibacter mangrovi]QID16546.1 PIN domain-containing protein [Nitrogeniibacter mangrovi]